MKLGKSLMSLAVVTAVAGLLLSAGDIRADPVAELENLNDRFNEAVANRDADAILSLYAEDTIWIEQGKPAIKGLEEPRKLFEFVTSNKGEVTHSVDTMLVSDDGTLAVMIGSVSAKVESVGMDATGTYLYVLKPSGGGWKVVTDMWHQHTE
ncbi:YybH family protein [Roseibium sp.]|uniref:YybH family protein n=1 Tax=Roseibium sp. TaxID=1936156 RepID=UPI003B5003D3